MLLYNSLQAIQSDLFASKITVRQVVEGYLQRIEEKKRLNVFLEVFADESLQTADALDKRIADNLQVGKLAGLVVGIKDLISFKGHGLTCSSKILDGFEAKFSATVVERLLKEDAIIIGRQNCDEFGMGSANKNSAYGRVLNNIDNSLVAGGSSGGSAVAVQADLCMVSLGSDTGGSVRQPAAFNGIIGFKPTYGRISRHGLAAFASSFDVIGILSKTLEDNEKVLEVISGKDNFDSSSVSNAFKSADKPTTSKKLVFFKQVMQSEGLSEDVRKQFQDKIQQLKEDGHKVEETDFPLLEYLLPTYYILTMAEASSNLSRYDGVRYVLRENDNSLEHLYKKTRSQGFGEEVKRRIMMGSFVLSAGYYDAYYTKAQRVRKVIKDKTTELLNTYDFIISPTAPGPAFKADKIKSSPIEEYLQDIFTVHASLAGLPAISIPLGKTKENLPIGFHLVANEFEEDALYSFSKYLVTL